MNLQPFLAACTELRSTIASRQTLVSLTDFMAAAEHLFEAIGPEFIPEIPEERRLQVRELINQLPKDQLSRILAGATLESLRQMNLFPTRKTLENEAALRARLLGLLDGPEEVPADSAAVGGIKLYSLPSTRETMRGFDDDTMIFGSLATDGPFRIERFGRNSRPAQPQDEDDRRPTLRREPEAEPLPPIPVVDVAAAPPSQVPTEGLPVAPPSPHLSLPLDAIQKAIQERHIPFETFLKMVQEGNFPLVNPQDGHLLIQGDLYVNLTQQTVPTIISSNYRLGKDIGEGGCSKVYLGYESGTEREVAIKIVTVRDETKRQRLYEGFVKEVRHQAFFKSARFVHVYATGRTSEGEPFIAMELLRGGALAEFIHRMKMGKFPFNLKQILSMACQMVAAVAEMHKQGLIHRDIKPENYFLDEEGQPKLGDCGLSEKLSDIPKTPQFEPWGTPGYIPPEVVKDSAPDDERRDVWALGTSLYELFTGVFPFEGNTPLSSMANVYLRNPQPPSRVTPHRNIPEVIDRIVMKCLEKDPAKRYANALEVLHELVTVRAQALEDEANDNRRMSSHTGADIKIHENIWRDRVMDALRELRRIYDDFPLPSILRKRIELNKALYDWASREGDWELLERTKESILGLDPQSPEAQEITQKTQARFYPDGDLPPRTQIQADVYRFQYQAKFIERPPVPAMRRRDVKGSFTAERGAFGVHFWAPGVHPVFIPLPPRVGKYDIRVPIYEDNLPPGSLIIPAGPVLARTDPGSFAELPAENNLRFVHHDYAVLPLRTGADWGEFLQSIEARQGRDSALKRLPKNWIWDTDRRSYVYKDTGAPVDFNLPVTHVLYEDSLEYLDFLSERLAKRVRHPRLNEWRRAFRGNDGRRGPWGDADPEAGIVGYRFANPRGPRALAPLALNAPGLRDESPFSVPERDGHPGIRITHLVGNVQKFLDLGDDDERARIAAAFEMSPQNLIDRNYVVCGSHYRSAAPILPDVLEPHPKDEVGLIGILPVIQLRDATPSPSAESLLASH